jgi:sarcosine oxidase subunit beta
MTSADYIIVGGGVIGSAIAYNLAKAKASVLVLEKQEVGAGGSSRNGGGVRQSGRDPRELPVAIFGVRELWPTLSEELDADVEYHNKGNLRLGKTAEHRKVLEKLVSQGQSAGLEQTLIEYGDIKNINPYVSEQVTAASWCTTDGHANPMRTTLAFYRRARQLGVRFISGEEVTSVLLAKGRAVGVQTKTESYFAGKVIVAAGYASRAVLATAGLDMPMFNLVDEALVTEALPPMFEQMLGTAAADYYGHQTDHGSFVFGGTIGLEEFISDEPRPATSSITAPYLCRAILAYFPCLKDVGIVRTWAGFIDKMADGVPVIDEIDEVPGLVAACGFSGHGFGISPAVGVLASELVLTGKPRLSLDAFGYDRFRAKS